MAVRDAAATRRRLLDAASEEFAVHGIAGGRVDRIAANANANKAQIYTYFGSKEGLFDAVFAEMLDAIIDAVPLDAVDLPGYAVALYDEYVARPELIRLATWARLERQPEGDLLGPRVAGELDQKLAAIAAAQASGHVDASLDPGDVYALVTTLSMVWSPASVIVAASKSDPDPVHEHRRELLAEMARRMFAPARASS
ncbi:TetR/AcrR family transcriptional regulator [Thermoleophilia bacterium SCSIO 60948]|nr:TetR/AcrR family transcriptional regulator [Thermoleophilia bacterium SCSIO 60948]